MPALAQVQSATVLSVGDGDTLRVREGNRTLNVRLACIDAPETSQAPHGASARSQLQALAPVGSTVELRVKTNDRYGRSVAELSRGGRNFNQALVASGAAFVYWQYIARCDRQTYGHLETEARLKGLGGLGRERRCDAPVGVQIPPANVQFKLSSTLRPALHLQTDRLLCPGPGVAEAGTQLSRRGW